MEDDHLVAALRPQSKMTAPMVLEGAMTGRCSSLYRTMPGSHAPAQRHRRDDNCRVHMGPAIREAIEKAHATLRYLPKYSPDLNPNRTALQQIQGVPP